MKIGVFKAILQTVKEFLYSFKYGITKNLKSFAMLLQIILPIIAIQYRLSFQESVVFSIVLYIGIKFINSVGNKINSVTDTGLPFPHKRFTYSDANGFIDIAEDNYTEAIQYLYDLEEYIESKGWK